ncbi:hypothetical protein [Vibrio chagasii]|uniref:hypothetical protein n=1 Tax=Vibrio chagasii TaxID=170679 RepID=UPI002283CE5E|nr:hypothetical protein [Vibrio chagasii]MCY9829408.1 hypothetical protein [Vibrio chagasii]
MISMSRKLRHLLLTIYGVLGVSGWYSYLYVIPNDSPVYDRLSSDLTVSYVRSLVWYHSRGKLQELRSILTEEAPLDKTRAKIRISNMLQHRTSVYIRDFNSLDTPIPKLGTWYENNFEFEDFLNSVYEVCFNEKLLIDERIRYVTDIMEEYQNRTTSNLITELQVKGE